MRSLDRKVWRNLREMRGQAIAIALVMACGVATFLMSLSTLDSLRRAQAKYYDRYRFGQVFAHLKRAPNVLAQRIREIPGVAGVQTRILSDVSLNVEGMAEPAVGRLVSLAGGSEQSLNRLHLKAGRFPEWGRSGEALASQAFVEAHGLELGASIQAVINGRRQQLHIVGTALSPEFIYEVQGGTELFPDSRRFGVFWMRRQELAAAFNMEGAFNDVNLSLMRGASEHEVRRRLDELLKPYGGQSSYGRSNHLSDRRVSDELLQLRSMALITPVIFLTVAAFLLYVVLSRLIGLQRGQIALLKGFGYSAAEIALHYSKIVFWIVAGGVVAGALLGAWMGRGLTRIYTQFFRFPFFEYQLDPRLLLLAFGVAAGAAVLGVAGSLRRVFLLPPAEAMRPEPPTSYRPALLERIGLGRFLAQIPRMIFRQLERRPVRSAMTCLGIALSMAVLIVGRSMSDCVEFVIDFQFNSSQRYDVSLGFVEPVSQAALHEIGQLPGVLEYEGFRSVPAVIRSAHRNRRPGITGLPSDPQLFRILDDAAQPLNLPPEGLLISAKLAEILQVQPGQSVRVEVLEGERPVGDLPVAALVTDFGGTAAYMNLQALRHMLKEGDNISGAFLSVDSTLENQLYARLKETPAVSSVSVKSALLKSFRELLADLLIRFQSINTALACIIAFGMVYNSARITLSERSWELATLRVMGFTRAEISQILLGEVAALTLLAIPIGLAVGYGFAALTVRAMDTETQHFPLVLTTASYAFAVAVTLAAALASGLIVRRRVDRLDLVEVLKSRE